METQKHVQFSSCWRVGILLTFFGGFGFCILVSSSSSEEARCKSNSDSNNSNVSTIYHFERHLMKSYFEKYNSLLESNFQDFVASELLCSSCQLLPDNPNRHLRVSVPWRHLIGEGSHRLISSTIRFHLQPDSLSQMHTHFCKAIIIERLPLGIFADPFELQHLLERGVFTDVAVFGDTNLELPSVLSNQSVVEVHMNVVPNFLLGHNDELEISVNIPLHARYPPLDDSGSSKVEFGAPDLFLHCNAEDNWDNESCLFMLTTCGAESGTGAAVWNIPAGMRAHTGIVSAVTFVAASISALLIVLTSIFHSDTKLCNNLKQP